MDTNDFSSIALVGTIVSTLVEFISRTLKVRGNSAKILTIGLSILLGAGVVYLQSTSFWPTILGVLASASTVYALFFNSKKIKSETN